MIADAENVFWAIENAQLYLHLLMTQNTSKLGPTRETHEKLMTLDNEKQHFADYGPNYQRKKLSDISDYQLHSEEEHKQ